MFIRIVIKCTLLAICVWVQSVAGEIAETNLLHNSGFESGIAEWTTDNGVIRNHDPAPHTGSYYLFGANNGSDTSYTYQIIGLIDAGFTPTELDSTPLEVHFGGYQSGWDTQHDSGKIEIIVTDGTNELTRADSGWFYSNHTWILREGTIDLPTGARFITFGFHADKKDGSDTDAFLDDAFLEIKQTLMPTSIIEVTLTDDMINLQISDLTSRTTNIVERNLNLLSTNWTQRGSFIAVGSSTNWSDTVQNNIPQAYYRISTSPLSK